MNSLKKVDFFWINRDQKSFEWFISLLLQLELEMSESGGSFGRFLDMHMYMTSGEIVKFLKSFWFGLPFGSPNPTSDFVTDDDYDDSNYVL